MTAHVVISDVAIWVKHIDFPPLQERLRTLPDNAAVSLEIDGVVGHWIKMKTGSDGRPTDAIRPYGSMRETWSKWYRERRGASMAIREVRHTDDYLKTVSALADEWASDADNAAFNDL